MWTFDDDKALSDKDIARSMTVMLRGDAVRSA